jgi:hypothetical protein
MQSTWFISFAITAQRPYRKYAVMPNPPMSLIGLKVPFTATALRHHCGLGVCLLRINNKDNAWLGIISLYREYLLQ